MSLSDSGEKRYSGKVILNSTSPGPDETTLQEMEGKKKPIWDDDTSKEYIDKVRDKAQAMAKDILAKAMAEAEQIKETARQEAFDQGMAQGEEMLNNQVTEFGQILSQALASIQEQGKAVWVQQKLDIVTLIRVAVEKTLLVEMSERRQEILANLLDQALDRIDSRHMINIRVKPESVELMQALLEEAQKSQPDLTRWKIKPDPSLEGGLVVESEEGMVDNGLPARWQGVEQIFDQLMAATAQAGEQAGEEQS